MNELGITSIRVGAKGRHQVFHEVKKLDHVQKNFTVKAPNEVWVSDSTSFKVNEQWFFICVIIDLFARKVIAYKISQKHTTNLMTATFRLAYENRKPAHVIFHSDRGTQFMKLLKVHGVTQSFSPTGTPYHNAVMESFFSSMKKEELYRHEYRSAKHFSECIDAYIHFYNEVRPHHYLKHKTPSVYEQAFFEHLNK